MIIIEYTVMLMRQIHTEHTDWDYCSADGFLVSVHLHLLSAFDVSLTKDWSVDVTRNAVSDQQLQNR